MNNKSEKLDFFIFLKFLWAIEWRSYLFSSLFGGIIGLGIAIFSFPKSFLSTFIFKLLCSIGVTFINTYILKYASTKVYETFEVFWDNGKPKSIFDKRFGLPLLIYMFFAWGIFIFVDIIFVDIYLNNIISGIAESFLLYIFIRKNWFNFQLVELTAKK